MSEFDSLWNFDDPSGTEARFRELLTAAEQSRDAGYVAQLLSQIARTQGLQRKFVEAHATLDQAESGVTPDLTMARARILLERGRVFNSSGKADASVPIFKEAANVARDAGLELYLVDALHMLGIVTKGDESLRWNEKAIKLSESAKEPGAKRFLGPLYNNTGWTYFDMGRYNDALRMFESDLELRKRGSNKVQVGIARWSIGKVLRYLDRVEEALQIQFDLLNQFEVDGGVNEGYTREEIGECLLLLGRPDEATQHFL